MKDRREYPRIRVSEKAILYVDDGREVNGEVFDISENGAGIWIRTEDQQYFEVGKGFRIYYLTHYSLDGRIEVIDANAVTARMQEDSEQPGRVLIGAQVRSAEYNTYVREVQITKIKNHEERVLSEEAFLGVNAGRMFGLARECYNLAIQGGLSEEEALDCYIMGLLSEVGKDFATDHKRATRDMLGHLGLGNLGIFRWDCIQKAIKNAGDAEKFNEHIQSKNYILNKALLLIDENGRERDIDERLEELKEKFGEDSEEYRQMEEIAFKM